jgi:hypothetical protein
MFERWMASSVTSIMYHSECVNTLDLSLLPYFKLKESPASYKGNSCAWQHKVPRHWLSRREISSYRTLTCPSLKPYWTGFSQNDCLRWPTMGGSGSVIFVVCLFIYSNIYIYLQLNMYLFCVCICFYRALVFICHGAGEHCLWYTTVALLLKEAGCYVFGHDHGNLFLLEHSWNWTVILTIEKEEEEQVYLCGASLKTQFL